MPRKLSIVIPCLNEENAIDQVLTQIFKIRSDLQSVGVDDLEVIVIDDASTDASWSLLQRWTSSHPVIAIRNRQRLNYGGSLKVGFRKATGHLIGFMDMDGTYAPEEFCRLINVLDLNTAVVVCGNRLSTISGMPWIRYLGNYFYVGLIRFLYGQRVDDGCTGQRVFARALLDELCEIPIMGAWCKTPRFSQS